MYSTYVFPCYEGLLVLDEGLLRLDYWLPGTGGFIAPLSIDLITSVLLDAPEAWLCVSLTSFSMYKCLQRERKSFTFQS